MSSIKTKGIALALGAFLLMAAPSARADEYADLTLSNITKILVRFGVYDIRKDDAIDFYGKVVECKIYRDNYIDDFKWNRVRGALRESIKQNIASFPTGIHYDTTLQLGKFDFHDGVYRFSEKTAQFNANVFHVTVHPSNFCTNDTPNLLPKDYLFTLDTPVHIAGLPMSAEEGNKLMNAMRDSGNKDLIVYTRFNMRVTYIAPIEAVGKDRPEGSGADKFILSSHNRFEGLRIDTHLDSIEYFQDSDRTKLIYRFTP